MLYKLNPIKCIHIAKIIDPSIEWDVAEDQPNQKRFVIKNNKKSDMIYISYDRKVHTDRFVQVKNGNSNTITTETLIDIFEFLK